MTVAFFAKPRTSLSALVGMRVLELLHDKGEEEFTGTADGKVKVPNYILGSFSDLKYAARIQIGKVEAETAKVEAPLCFVGGNFLPSPSQLCTDHETCRPPRHHCAGVFGLLDEFNIIRISCCRPRPQEIRPHGAVTRELVRDPDPEAFRNTRKTVNAFEKLIYDVQKDSVTDDETKLEAARVAFESFTPKDQARTLGDSLIASLWYEIQCARDQRAREGDWGLYVYYTTMDGQVKRQIVQNKNLKAALVKCRQQADALSDNTKCHKWFDSLPAQDQRWVTKLSPDVERWAKPMFAFNRIRDAGVYALWNKGLPISAFAALKGLTQGDRIIKAYAESEPATVEVSGVGEAFVTRWKDPNTTDADRQADWDMLPEEERRALSRLVPQTVAAWQMREYLHGAIGALPSPCILTAYLWLLHQEEGVQDAAALHPDWTDVIDNGLEILDRWADQATTDAHRLSDWQTWPEHEREALSQLAPDAVNAWKARAGVP
ncbi:hypothetical protein ACTVZO_44575 [Streptomyces sp. IBSNAI002]|uniref:hypothetical protein n=1 Tax=Streptomyces sp. IBSNAI002 TaxID=3457500 RepID=UPI003FD1B063